MNKVYVVEGLHDLSRLKEVDKDLDVIITGGSALNESVIQKLKTLSINHEIVLFFDADNAGERLRRILSKIIPHATHAFLDREASISKNGKKVGVEHASLTAIKDAIQYNKKAVNQSNITNDFLIDMGLIGIKDAQTKRRLLCQQLQIGYVNGKGLLDRLILFGYNQQDILEVFNATKQT